MIRKNKTVIGFVTLLVAIFAASVALNWLTPPVSAQFVDRITRPCALGGGSGLVQVTTSNILLNPCTGGSVTINGVAVTPGGGGGVTGTGTTNTLPIWTDGAGGVLGDSPIRKNGSDLEIGFTATINNLYIGNGSFNTNPVTYAIRATNHTSANNAAGGSLSMVAGQGTGNAVGAVLNFVTPSIEASGSTPQSDVIRWTIDQTGTLSAKNSSPLQLAITGATQCLHVNTGGVVTGTGADCAAGASITNIAPAGTVPITIDGSGNLGASLIGTAAQFGGKSRTTDALAATTTFQGESAFSQATTTANRTGGDLYISAGMGSKRYSVLDNTLGVVSVTITIPQTAGQLSNQTAVTLTSGTDFTLGTDNTAPQLAVTATNLAAAINANATLPTYLSAVASTSFVYLTKTNAGRAVSLASSNNSAILSLQNNDGAIVMTGVSFEVKGSIQISSGGSNNTIVGNSAGNLTSAPLGHNSLFGQSAGAKLTSGTDNSFFGHQAGLNATGTSNTFYGSQSGSAITSGVRNAFFGTQAGNGPTTESDNTFLGDSAGLSNTPGVSGSIAIGSGSQTTVTGQLAIGSNVNSPITDIITYAGTAGGTQTWRTSNAAGTNQAGLGVTYKAGASTGNAAGGSFIWQVTPAAAGSGSGVNAFVTALTINSNGAVTLTPAPRLSGVASYFTLNIPADTAQTAATESIGYQHVTATRQWASTGTVALQRENFLAGPTYSSASASQTFTDVFTLYVTPPVQGTNAIFTRPHTLGIVDSTSAASSITGAVVISTTLGTTATSVGIGAGNINAGNNGTFGGTLSVTGHVTFEGVTSTGATGTGALVFGTSPTFTTSAISPLFRSTAAKVLFQGTGTGATQLASTQTTVPTCTTNCGTGSPTVTGTDSDMLITLGTTPASAFQVNFNGTWAAAPVCVAASALASMVVGKQVIAIATTTTTATLTTNGTAPATADKYFMICRGTQ